MLRAFFFWGILTAAVCAEELRLVQFSDVHGGGPHFSQAAFAEACRQGLALHPQGLLLTGDHGDNSYDQAGFRQRFSAAVAQWKEPLRDYAGDLFFALGNDDFGRNYQSEPDDLRHTQAVCRETFGARYYLDELGNGRSPSRLGGLRWLSLNSQLFSPLNHTPQADQQARATLEWLKAELAQTDNSQPVVLLSHIAPVWDLHNRKPAWKPEYLTQLEGLLRDYPGQVLIFSGHHHRNHVQGMRPERPIPILTGGALATKYGYQPNWREYRWDTEVGQRVDELAYTLHYPGHSDWQISYRLRPDHLQEFFERLGGDAAFYREYVRDVYGHHSQWEELAADPERRQALLDEFWVASDP